MIPRAPLSPAEQADRSGIADYDADGYDYRQFWRDRAYEDWAEARVIRQCLRPHASVPWLIDLGGGFGRHLSNYGPFAQRIVLVDYSWTNLRAAEAQLAERPQLAARVELVRANLYHLPFRDRAFDVALTARVLHHMQDLPAALREMGRVVQRHWLLDVPSKQHLHARLRAIAQGDWRFTSGRTPEPREVGTGDEPYRNYQIASVRDLLCDLGWHSRVAASVANLRGWERICPPAVRPLARPAIYTVEMLAQPLGRTWWGPSQWLWLTRSETHPHCNDLGRQHHAVRPPFGDEGAGQAAAASEPSFTARLRCPRCAGALEWAAESARCAACDATYERHGHIWDFAVR